MSRKTFLLILRIVAVVAITAILVPRIVDFINEPDAEEEIVGYSAGTVVGVVSEIVEEGEVTLGEVTHPIKL